MTIDEVRAVIESGEPVEVATSDLRFQGTVIEIAAHDPHRYWVRCTWDYLEKAYYYCRFPCELRKVPE